MIVELSRPGLAPVSATAASEHTARAATANMLVMVLNVFLLFFLPFLPCKPTVNNGRDLSRFQAAVQHCCSSKTSKTPHRSGSHHFLPSVINK